MSSQERQFHFGQIVKIVSTGQAGAVDTCETDRVKVLTLDGKIKWYPIKDVEEE